MSIENIIWISAAHYYSYNIMPLTPQVGSRRTADDKWDDFFKHDGGKIGGKVDFYSENAVEFDRGQ